MFLFQTNTVHKRLLKKSSKSVFNSNVAQIAIILQANILEKKTFT